jgi:hypothetical protein
MWPTQNKAGANMHLSAKQLLKAALLLTAAACTVWLMLLQLPALELKKYINKKMLELRR